jgi:O-phospho-L-seryl-tRNASec:L-selenocysteinyl-tRNA synthase
MVVAGLEPVVVPLKQQGDELLTDMHCLAEELRRVGPDSVVAIVSTTSCFAPRYMTY